MENTFYFWLLDNQCWTKNERFSPFIDECIDNTDLFNFTNEYDFYQYLYVNGYSEEVLLSFLYLWHLYEASTINQS